MTARTTSGVVGRERELARLTHALTEVAVALVELSRAIVAGRHARERLAAEHVQRAARHAAECQADPDLVPALHDRLRARAATGGRGAPAPSLVPPLVIDGLDHEIRDGERRVSLASRPVLRQLLYAFVATDDRYLDHDAITRALWGCAYDPLRHASSVHSSLRRLRGLIAGTRLAIETEGAGYRMSVPPFTTIVPPRSSR